MLQVSNRDVQRAMNSTLWVTGILALVAWGAFAGMLFFESQRGAAFWLVLGWPLVFLVFALSFWTDCCRAVDNDAGKPSLRALLWCLGMGFAIVGCTVMACTASIEILSVEIFKALAE